MGNSFRPFIQQIYTILQRIGTSRLYALYKNGFIIVIIIKVLSPSLVKKIHSHISWVLFKLTTFAILEQTLYPKTSENAWLLEAVQILYFSSG